MRFQNVGKFRAAFQRGGILRIREKLDALLLEERRFRWKTPRRFVLARQFFGFDLAGFDVRLIEGVDPDDRTGDGRGDFPRSEEHTSELQSHVKLVCRLLLEKKKKIKKSIIFIIKKKIKKKIN